MLTTSYNMNFFYLNDDVKSIITKHLLGDYFISTMFMSKHQDLQKHSLARLYLITIFVKLQKYKMI
jgi:hypothetical protein